MRGECSPCHHSACGEHKSCPFSDQGASAWANRCPYVKNVLLSRFLCCVYTVLVAPEARENSFLGHRFPSRPVRSYHLCGICFGKEVHTSSSCCHVGARNTPRGVYVCGLFFLFWIDRASRQCVCVCLCLCVCVCVCVRTVNICAHRYCASFECVFFYGLKYCLPFGVELQNLENTGYFYNMINTLWL